jgi:hypothetical protein
VGGGLDLRSHLSVPTKPVDYPMFWQEGKYIFVDGILQEVVGKKGNIYYVKSINKEEISYLVTDGNNKYAHGNTLSEARKSLIFKIGNRDKSKYEKLNSLHTFSLGEAIECYRVITGACEGGVRNFMERKEIDKIKDNYSIQEIITLTEGDYGSKEFKEFFKNKGV